MSKRTGKSVTLNELIEEVGTTDAARSSSSSVSMDSQLLLDLTLATLNIPRQSGVLPRTVCPCLSAVSCGAGRGQCGPDRLRDPTVLKEPIEIDLIKKLNDYEELIETAAAERAPLKILGASAWTICKLAKSQKGGRNAHQVYFCNGRCVSSLQGIHGALGRLLKSRGKVTIQKFRFKVHQQTDPGAPYQHGRSVFVTDDGAGNRPGSGASYERSSSTSA